MNLVYVADAPRIGGAEQYLVTVAGGAAAAGHAVRVIAPQEDLLDLVRDEIPAASLVRAGSDAYATAPDPVRRVARLAGAARTVGAAVRAGQPDVLHLNNGGYPGSDLVRLTAMIAPAPPSSHRVMSVHSVPWSREDGGARVQQVTDRALWPRLGAVIGATRIVGHALSDARGMPAALYRRIPYGVDAPGGVEEAEEIRARHAGADQLLVGMVSATADPGKGHAVLAAAIARADERVRAVIIGADPGDAFRDDLRARGIADRVTVLGRVPEVGPYLHAMDLLVVPSTEFESLPLVILEAMGAGTPVLGSRLAGIPEAIEDGVTGALFEPGDVHALTGLLDAAVTDRSALSAQGRAALTRWEARFSREAMVAAVLSVYDDLAPVH